MRGYSRNKRTTYRMWQHSYVLNNFTFQVGPETNVSLAQCICNHLTTFAGGWVVMPNTIDWNFVFSNADFMKNPTLYATMITITVVYLVVVVWARRQDKRDVEKVCGVRSKHYKLIKRNLYSTNE